MAEFDDKLNSILSNPQIMSQIMSMAGAMNQSQNPPAPAPQQPQQNNALPFDPGALQGMMEMMKRTQIAPKEQNLLRALRGYLPDDRIQKLEKAMQAARIAQYASTALGSKSNPSR